MKSLLQLIMIVALPLILAHGRPVAAPLPADVRAISGPAITGDSAPAPSSVTAVQPLATSLDGAAPAAPVPPELRSEGDPDIPLKGSPLLLLSIIGFGLLIGGMVPAMRHRKITGVHS
jgi:hypothetical protein